MPRAKRPAVESGAEPGSKRAAAEVTKKCGLVCKALKTVDDLPPRVVELLRSSVGDVLQVYEDKRHEYQNQVVEWTGTALASVDKKLESAIGEATAAITKTDEDKAAAQAAVAPKEAEVGGLKETKATQKAAADAAAAALKEAQKAQSAMESAQVEGDKPLAAAAKKKEAVETCDREGLQPLLDGTASGAKKVNALVASGRKFSMDENLLLALDRTLKLPKEARTSFDGVVLEQFKVALDKIAAECQKVLDEGEAGKAARASDVATASAATAAAATAAEEAKATLAATTGDLAAKEAELKELAGAVLAHEATASVVQGTAEAATAALESFRDGPLAAFKELRSRSTPPPPVPAAPVVEAAAAPEAAAPAEAAAAPPA